MKRFLIFGFITIISSTANINYAISKEEIKIVNPKYQNEKVELCPTFEEYEKNPNLYNITCFVNYNDTFTPQKVDLAIDFVKKIKYVYRTEDFIALVNLLPYPLYINNYKKRNIVINSNKELLKLNKKIILNQSILKTIDNNKLFWNWQGYSIGNGKIWFRIDNNNISDVTINL